jgi:hypothetical protein
MRGPYPGQRCVDPQIRHAAQPTSRGHIQSRAAPWSSFCHGGQPEYLEHSAVQQAPEHMLKAEILEQIHVMMPEHHPGGHVARVPLCHASSLRPLLCGALASC